MKYISIGNSSFNRDIIEILNLHEFDIYYPIDRAISSISVLNDCLSNGWEKFLDIGNPQTGLNNDDLIHFNEHNGTDQEILNAYQCIFYFLGISIYSNDDVKRLLGEWIDNLMNAINGTEDLTFIFTNQNAMIDKVYRDNQHLYYDRLLEFVDIIKTKYNKHNVRVLAFFTNESYTNTQEVQTYKIDIPEDVISDNHETYNPDTTQIFINQFLQKMTEILN
jgi:hypothetical protein